MRIYTKMKSNRGRTYTCGKCSEEIQAGEVYYEWNPRSGTRRRHERCGRPRQSELTTSDKLSRLYAASESIDDAMGTDYELADILRSAAEEAREVGSEYEESADNMEQYFSGSSQVDEIREKAQMSEDWADALESAADEIEALEEDEDIEDEQERAEALRGAAETLAQDAQGELQL